MTRLLIVYGTTDGQTGKIARFLSGELASLGAVVDVCNAAESSPHPGGYDGVIVAASVHASGYQRALVRWVRGHAEPLRAITSAFVSVCLGILQKDLAVHRELGAIINRFEGRTGWKPTRVTIAAGALLYTRYGWLKRAVMRRIARKARGSTDVSRDHEYTDWYELSDFAGEFFASCRGQDAPAEASGTGSCCSAGCGCKEVKITA